MSLAWTPNAKWSVTQNYFAGPVIDGFAETTAIIVTDWKQLSDTVDILYAECEVGVHAEW